MAKDLTAQTAEIVAAYLSHHTVAQADVSSLIGTVYNALSSAEKPVVEPEADEPLKPAVPVKKSVQPDYIICLEDGKKCKMLKRHLMSSFGLTPDAYRTKWGLPSEYPMVAPNYAKQRSQLALSLGLGRSRKAAV